jgi:rhamnogalacturonan endolyase
MLAFTSALFAQTPLSDRPVSVLEQADAITLQNGNVQIRVDRVDGSLKSIRQRDAGSASGWHDLSVNGVRAAYEAHGDDFANDPEKALYWDANADVHPVPPGMKLATKGYFRLSDGEPEVKVIADTSERAEVTVRSKPTALFPFDVDWHYVVLRGQSGFYVYVELHHGKDQPAVTYYQNRFVVKTVMDGTFTHWAIGDGKFVPIPQASIAKQVSDATFQLADGTIKTKYMNSVYWSEVPVYGYVGDHRGLWMIEASPEYHNGGPIKQGQTLHDNVMLRVMQSVHFGASPVELAAGEEFSKVYGPFLVYLNQGNGPKALWQDAWQQYQTQRANWPYQWVDSPDYVKERGDVTGKVELGHQAAHAAWAILTPAGNDWSAQTKGYAFWQQLDTDGGFDLKHVVPGRYDLYLSGADQPHDVAYRNLDVSAGEKIDLGTLQWTPETHGERLWQIGTFDRSAKEYRDGDNARNFEMYKRYAVAFPADVDYTIGQSDPTRDWNYAQWTVYNQRPDWRIHFTLAQPQPQSEPLTGTATLTIGFASSQPARGKSLTDLRVAVNGTQIAALHLPKTGTAGYRGGVQDSRYNVRELSFDAALLKPGQNLITLQHADAEPLAQFDKQRTDTRIPANTTPGQVMYDALRLELSRSASRASMN